MDRNNAVQIVIVVVHASLSARRAWIEIGISFARKIRTVVALRKESVDRNLQTFQTAFCWPGRSPQGERG